MARPGQQISNPVSGFRLEFLATAESSGGELLDLEAVYESGSRQPPMHFHPSQGERFEVLEGSMQVRIGSQPSRELATGETLEVAAGVRHSIWNGGPDDARVRWQTRPALNTEQFLETICALAHRGRLGERGPANPLQGALLMREFKDVFRLASPPPLVQDVLLPPLALLGRLTGQRPPAEP